MASGSETVEPDYLKGVADLENDKCQMNLNEPQTPEIAPASSCDITNINSPPLGGVSIDDVKLTDPSDADNNSFGDKITDSSPSDKKLKSEEVTTHPLQENSDCDTNDDAHVGDSDQVQRTNKKNRHVFFPEDGHIVSGYMEPPVPWNDASQCSTEELIDAYKKACERFGVKPLPRLLQQLNVINDFSDRNETLTLRGERLDSKHCETIEEILRRVQFRTVDLENAHLDDEGTVALFDMIEHYESCNRLNISNNRTIGIRGWQACARLMKKTPCLETLEARNCVISEQVMPFFCRSLKLGSSLTVLHLENSIMSGKHLIILAQALKMNDTLLELYLADNKLMPSDGIQLGNMLRYNYTLQLLDVRNNHLQDVGVSHICDGLWEQNIGQGLATIVLWNNQVTYQAMNSLSRALTNTRSLETLNLGHNNITNEGIHRLKDGLLRNKSLLRIGLQASKISCEGAVALAEFIAESPRLRRIDLRENDIKTGGLMALSLSLKVSHSVTRIDLDKETKREMSMKDYAEQQQRLMNDINNYMQRNRELIRQQEEMNEKLQQEKQKQQEEKHQQQQQQQQQENEEEKANDMNNEETEQVSEDAPVMDNASLVKRQDEGLTDGLTKTDSAGRVQQLYSQRPDNLDLNSNRGPHTLDSPAFLCDSALATFSESLQLECDLDKEKATNGSNAQVFFPPSPIVSDNGRPTLAPILGSAPSVISPETQNSIATSVSLLSTTQPSDMPKEILRKSPCSSPTTKRKFIISRVQEPSKLLSALSPTDSAASASFSDDEPVSPAEDVLASGLAGVVINESSSNQTVADSVISTKTGEIATETLSAASSWVCVSAGKAASPTLGEVCNSGTEIAKHASEVLCADSLSPSQDDGGSEEELSMPETELGTNSDTMLRALVAQVASATSADGSGSAAMSVDPSCGDVSGSEEPNNMVSSQSVKILETDEAVHMLDNISEANQPLSLSDSVDTTAGRNVKDSCKSENAHGVTIPNDEKENNKALTDILLDSNTIPSQCAGDCTKTASELTSLNGVSQLIVNPQKTLDANEKLDECDTATSAEDNSNPDCSTSEKLDSFERELDVLLSNLPDATSS